MSDSVADPGCLSRIQDPKAKKAPDPDPQQRIQAFLTQIIDTKLSEI
jgi:hypothetical protein